MQSCNATIRRNPIGRVHGSLQSLQQKHMAQSSECCSPLVTPLVSGDKQGSASSMTMASSASGVKKSSLSNLLGTFHHRKQLAFFAFRFARGRLGAASDFLFPSSSRKGTLRIDYNVNSLLRPPSLSLSSLLTTPPIVCTTLKSSRNILSSELLVA